MATEYDYWKIFQRMQKKVEIGDITIRDGFQHSEKFVSTAAKIFYGQEMILAGAKEIEILIWAARKGFPSSKTPTRSLPQCGATVSRSAVQGQRSIMTKSS